MMTRRQALKSAAVLATLASSGAFLQTNAQPAAPATAAPTGPFKLPPLPYSVDALEPNIDARTMEIHHDRHHAAYVANLNKAVADYPNLAAKSVDALISDLNSLPEKVRTAIRNNGGGHSNHSLFWQMMAKNGGGRPKGELAKAIDNKFGNFAGFQEQLTKAALSVFGSGWAWLSMDAGKDLRIEATPNQDTPVMNGRVPLLGIDVWEHAYYLKYQNKRADYINAFYNVINWDFVTERFRKGGSGA